MSGPPATLALLPFANLTDSLEDGRLAVGFQHDLIAELSCFPWLGVIAASSVSAAQQEGLSDEALAERIGASHLLRGSLRRGNGGVRISVQLVEARSGQHLWAGRYDGPELEAIHDEIAAKVSNALASQLNQTLLVAAR